MKIAYITNVRIPTSRAQGYAVMKMCEEFSMHGASVHLYIPNRKDSDKLGEAFSYYSIKKIFEIKNLPGTDFLSMTYLFGKLTYWLDILSFLISTKFFIKLEKDEIVYTRDFLIPLVLPKKRFVSLELHEIPKSKWLFRKAIKKTDVFFVLTEGIKSVLLKEGISSDKIYITPSGVQLSDFDIDISKETARQKLSLPLDKNIVVYTGHLYDWKGVHTLAQAALLLPETVFVFVGGVEPELSNFVSKYSKYNNVIIHPFVERSLIPMYLKASDVLVIPNSAHTNISSHYTSPLKLFEYMASNRPIVASDLASIREVLSESNSVFAKPDNSKSFAESIRRILSDENLAKSISEKALKDVAQYGWSSRAKKILEIIHSKNV